MGASSSLVQSTEQLKLASSMGKDTKQQAISTRRINRNIEKQIAEDRKRGKGLMKILCLGTSCSGKSTILKQMRILHQDGFKGDDKDIHKDSFLYTFVTSAYELLHKLPDCECDAKIKQLRLDLFRLSHMKAKLIKDQTELISKVFAYFQTKEGEVLISTYGQGEQCGTFLVYFLERVEDVERYNQFVLNTDDILRIRVQTTGVVFTNFSYKKANFCMVDVGGQKTERRKWIHLFDDVKAIFFVVDLSNFDDMSESMDVFKGICSTTALSEANIILFFNKTDIFKQKKNLWDISKHFPDFNETLCTHREAGLFIKKKFENEFKRLHPNGLIYSFFTCATDTSNIDKTFAASSDIILKKSLAAAGLY